MSWHFSFSARGHEEAKAKLAEHQQINCHTPAAVFAAAQELIESLPDTGDRALVVTSHGHIDGTTASSAMIQVDFAAGVDVAPDAAASNAEKSAGETGGESSAE